MRKFRDPGSFYSTDSNKLKGLPIKQTVNVDLYLIIGLILSALIGLSLGLIGGGGSIITVPVLVYVIGVDAHDAVAMSLAVVGATSLIGAFLHYRRGTVRVRAGLIFGAAGVLGALAGSPLTHLLSPPLLMLTFGALMLVVAVLMLRGGANAVETTTEVVLETDWRKSVAAGFGVGVMTGFLGVGGGFLILPSLVMFGGLKMKEAIGTSLLVIFINCVAGLAGHASQINFDWTLTMLVMAMASVGAIVGTLLSDKVAANRLQKVFAVFVTIIAVILLAANIGFLFT